MDFHMCLMLSLLLCQDLGLPLQLPLLHPSAVRSFTLLFVATSQHTRVPASESEYPLQKVFRDSLSRFALGIFFLSLKLKTQLELLLDPST